MPGSDVEEFRAQYALPTGEPTAYDFKNSGHHTSPALIHKLPLLQEHEACVKFR